MIQKGVDSEVQYIWQCGKYYFEQLKSKVSEKENPSIKLLAFISRMDAAYASADVIVSRAGALSVSELCLVGKPVILVPSPNVSEDHQTKNAMSLVNADAALMVRDLDCANGLINNVNSLLADADLSGRLSRNILGLARPNATSDIIDESENILLQ
jgi:UDP-N-acetylglucosamine--N-acetylmuramyl-(pentapeptide) pyrophosphoryl-undecaprenol N-acetylglucosamine transferase